MISSYVYENASGQLVDRNAYATLSTYVTHKIVNIYEVREVLLGFCCHVSGLFDIEEVFWYMPTEGLHFSKRTVCSTTALFVVSQTLR